MNIRQFLVSAPALAAAAPLAAQSSRLSDPRTDYKPGKAVMVVGCQRGPINEKYLNLLKRSGVDDVCGMVRPGPKGYMEADDISQQMDLCAKHGIKLMMSEINGLASSYIGRAANPSIMMGKSPERDKAIDDVCMSLRNCAKAGLPAVQYNMSVLGVLSSGRVPGRGGVSAREWDLSKAKQDPPLTEAGPSPAPVMWERITYFLDRAIPVANEYKVRMACHPHDPGVPPSGFRGVDRVIGTVEGLKKFISIQESPYHGLNFRIPARKSSTSSATSASVRRSSTSTSATSAANVTSSSRLTRTKAT